MRVVSTGEGEMPFDTTGEGPGSGAGVDVGPGAGSGVAPRVGSGGVGDCDELQPVSAPANPPSVKTNEWCKNLRRDIIFLPPRAVWFILHGEGDKDGQ